MMDPSQPLGSILGFTQIDPMTNNPMTVANALVNYDNEYVWHCHILGHEENDFMRPFIFHPVVNVPDAPSNLHDYNNDGRLTWTDPTPALGVDAAGITTLGNVKNEIGFKVQRASNGGQFTQVADVMANSTSWQDLTPPPLGTDYSYKVTAYNVSGNSAPSNIAYMSSAPAAPTNLAAPLVADNFVALTWKDNSGNETSYQVWRDGALIANLPANTQNFVDNTVTEVTTYSYEVIAVNAIGTATSGLIAVTTPVAIAAPTGLTAVPNAAGTQVALRWIDRANNETAYLVEVSTGGLFSTVTTINRTAAQGTATGGAVTYNAAVVAGSVYTYRITALKPFGLGTKSSAPITVVADLSAPAAPTAPSGLSASLASATQVALTWVDNASTENAYVVEASTNGGAFVQLAVINRNAANRVATGGNVNYNAAVVAGNTYTFQVKAQATQYGLTTPSAYDVPVSVSVTAPIAPTNVAAVAGGVAGSLVVNWSDVSNNESGFTVQRSLLNAAGTVWGAFGNVGTVAANVTTITDTGRITGRSYRYQVRANGVVGNSVYVGPSNIIVAP
jgi:fibronectin type 3 domain-containing protein